MIISSRTRTILGVSLGLLAGIVIILAPGLVAVSQSPGQSWHGFATGSTHPNTNTNSQNSTSPNANGSSSNSSNQTLTVTPTSTTNGFTGTIDQIQKNNNSSTQDKAGSGSIPVIGSIYSGHSPISLFGIGIIVATLIGPAVAFSLVLRTWSIRRNYRNDPLRSLEHDN